MFVNSTDVVVGDLVLPSCAVGRSRVFYARMVVCGWMGWLLCIPVVSCE